MLPALSNVPRTDHEWQDWAWQHRQSHARIIQQIAAKKNVMLSEYQVEPISPDAPQLFLANNTSMHISMNSTLGLTSGDLEDADLTDPRQLEAWIKLHYQEHFAAEAALGA